MPRTDDFATSIELRYLVDRALAARQAGRRDVADIFGRAAERLVQAAMPDIAHDVSKIASRKGVGGDVASKLALRLTPAWAGVVFVIWSFRNARQPAIQTLSKAFRHDPVFSETVRLLCFRIFTPATVAAPFPLMTTAPIEVASPRQR